jgi:hypothetical protein
MQLRPRLDGWGLAAGDHACPCRHVQGLVNPQNPIGMLVGTKLLRLITNLTDANLSGLAWHIRGIIALVHDHHVGPIAAW